VIAANSDVGVLYGAFAFLRLIQTRQPIAALNITSVPKTKTRIIDHWDNLNGTIERGYAGQSIWNWPSLPEYLPPRLTDYARADASIGINSVTLNNVSAETGFLSQPYIEKEAAIASVLRPYGIRVYLSVRWSAPMEIGHLKNADPLDPAVKAWWQAEVENIYRAIPDFGGFVVKANSEGRAITIAPTPMAPTCWPMCWRRIMAWYSGVPLSIPTIANRIAPARPTKSSCRWTENSATMSCFR
jgi:alpha-glucuronidase